VIIIKTGSAILVTIYADDARTASVAAEKVADSLVSKGY
jgi:hypothetical protein